MKKMKYLLLFEDFNIDNLKKQFKIRDEVISYFNSLKNINHNRKDVNVDKVILWYAKILNDDIKNKFKKSLNYLFNKPDRIQDFNVCKEYLDYLNFKIETLEGNKLDVLKYVLDDLYKYISYKMTNINDYIFSSLRDDKINFINTTVDEMNTKANEWHEELKSSEDLIDKETNKIIIDYGDFYWVDLESNDCVEEGSAMGHCGRTSADTLLSLRERKKYGIEPHTTIAIDGDIDNYTTIYQIKGRGNKKPVSKYHKYIVDFLIKNEGVYIGDDEYDRSQDFSISDLDYNTYKNEVNQLFERDFVTLDSMNEFTDEYKKYYIDYLKNNNKLSQSTIAHLYENKNIDKSDVEKYGKGFKFLGDKLYGKVDFDIIKDYLIFEDGEFDKYDIKKCIKYSFKEISPRDKYLYDEIGFNGELELSKFSDTFIEKLINNIVKERGSNDLETFIDKNESIRELFREYRADWDIPALLEDKELLEVFVLKYGDEDIRKIETVANSIHANNRIDNYNLIKIINDCFDKDVRTNDGIRIIKENESIYILINRFIDNILIDYDLDILNNDLNSSFSSEEKSIFKGEEQFIINCINNFLKKYTIDYREIEKNI
jgi:hypothetical protein